MFYHTGIGVGLPRKFNECPCLVRKKLYIHYSKEENWLASYFRALRNNVLFHMPLPWRIRVVHDLDLHLKRMLFHQETMRDTERESTFEEFYAKVLGDETIALPEETRAGGFFL
mmetsp:Transcript_1424/g.2217  ORF Transcript_1424/g.2217 Transcript_1424/m.2217 type:complete len:114 (+) Transcript_1424:2180-2521(+)